MGRGPAQLLAVQPLGDQLDEALAFIATDSTGALPVWAAIGLIFIGAAIGGLLLFLIFQIKQCFERPQTHEESCDPLLPKTDAECDPILG